MRCGHGRRTTLPAHGWKLLIAGEGSEREQLAELARELGLSDSVEFLGVRRDVGDLMRRASIFVATTSDRGVRFECCGSDGRGNFP